MNDSEIFLAGGGGKAIPVWSSPMNLKHLDIVMSDIDGAYYQIFNNASTAVVVTVGPGNQANAKTAWTTGWRRVNDSDKPGDMRVLRDVGSNTAIVDGIKTYLRGGAIISVSSQNDYPGLPANAFSIFTFWNTGVINTPSITAAAYAGGCGISSGTFKNYFMVAPASAGSSTDAPKCWYTADGAATWFPGPTLGTTANFNTRIACNGEKRFYRVSAALTEMYYCDAIGAGIESSWTTTGGSIGITLGAGFATGSLEYLGSTGAKPTTDCLLLIDSAVIPPGGTNTAVAFTGNGGASWSRPTLFGMNASIKAVMVLSNGSGHNILLGATKTTSPTGVQAWYNSSYGSGTWVSTLEMGTYYNVCGGCWDGERYVVAFMSAVGVDIFAGVIQPDNSVTFVKISKVSLSAYITGDGHKNSGNGIYYSRGQYFIRQTAKQTIFQSMGAIIDLTLTPITPVNGGTFLNSAGFGQVGDICFGFSQNTAAFRSALTVGVQASYKPSPDTVECLRIV